MAEINSQLASALLSFLIAGSILHLVRHNHLHGSYALWWLSGAAAILVLGAIPSLMDWIGGVTGVHYSPILAIIVGMGMILIRMLRSDIEHSRQERELKRQAKKLAVLEHNIEAARWGHRTLSNRPVPAKPRGTLLR